MKTSKKIIVLTLSSLFMAGAIAQTPAQLPKGTFTTTTTAKTVAIPLAANTTPQPAININNNINTLTAKETGKTQLGSATLAKTTVAVPNAGNAYEKETTPLLRRIAQKKATLMEKKLDAELEQAEANIIKAKNEKNNPESATASNLGVNTNPKIIDVSNAANNPLVLAPVVQPEPSRRSRVKVEDDFSMMPQSDVRVLMTYGFDDNLYAKITSGNQGGYPVTKGDILPDGRQVIEVSSNYITVKFPSKKAPAQKIYVGANNNIADGMNGTNNGNAMNGVNSSSGNASSANILPLMGPMSSSPVVGTSGNVDVQRARLPGNLPGLGRN